MTLFSTETDLAMITFFFSPTVMLAENYVDFSPKKAFYFLPHILDFAIPTVKLRAVDCSTIQFWTIFF